MRTERERERAEERAKEVADSRILVAKGLRAERFLKDEFWMLDLEPMLAKIQSDAVEQKGWSPGNGKGIEELALCSAYFSAADHTVGEVLRKIKLMIVAGKEAEEYLKKEDGK